MDYRALLEKYNLLLDENERLAEENNGLKAQLGMSTSEVSKTRTARIITNDTMLGDESTASISFSGVSNASDSISKIRLFMSFFKGRDDIYATRWENKKKGTSGV